MAIEQMRLRRPGDVWLVPVRFDDCQISDWDLGADRSLTRFQRADLFGDSYEQNAQLLVQAI
jgi:hypothetical protein